MKQINELIQVYDSEIKHGVFWNNGYISGDFKDVMDKSMELIGFKYNKSSKTVHIESFDDWGDFRKLHKIKQALKDLVKAKIIDLNWKLTISSIKLGTIKDVLNINTHYNKVIPMCYHGTSTYYLEDIKRNGLQQKSETHVDDNWDKFYTDESVNRIYLTVDPIKARYYADHTNEVIKKATNSKIYKPVIIHLKNIPIINVTADDDFMQNMSMIALLQLIRTGKKADPTNYIQSIRNTSQFAHKGSIAPKYIDKITFK